MTQEQMEILVSQYLDGTLDELQRPAVEEQLRHDGEARRLLEEHRKLDALLGQLPPVPAVDWDRLAQHLSAAVAREEAPVGRSALRNLFAVRRLAVAAAVLLASALGVGVYLANASRGQMIVQGPQIEPAPGPALVQIEIGPSPLAADLDLWNGDGVVTRPGQLVIASGAEPGQDGDRPY